MAPRIVRPAHDRPRWVAATTAGVVLVGLGYAGGLRVFQPARAADQGGDESTNGPTVATVVVPGVAEDAGGRTAVAAIDPTTTPEPRPARVEPLAVAPRVPLRIAHSTVQSCGDGEELNLPGARCEAVPGIDERLRMHLQQLGNCPAAESAGATPTSVLSIGLRVDFARHRVTALPGRSSAVRNPLTFVPCARAAFDHANDLWDAHPAHPRYLYFFSMYFGPVTPMPVAPVPRAVAATPMSTPPVQPVPSGHATPGSTTNDSAVVLWPRVVVRDVARTGAIVGRLNQGAPVTVIGRQPRWSQIRWPGGTGWVYSEALGRRGSQ